MLTVRGEPLQSTAVTALAFTQAVGMTKWKWETLLDPPVNDSNTNVAVSSPKKEAYALTVSLVLQALLGF